MNLDRRTFFWCLGGTGLETALASLLRRPVASGDRNPVWHPDCPYDPVLHACVLDDAAYNLGQTRWNALSAWINAPGQWVEPRAAGGFRKTDRVGETGQYEVTCRTPAEFHLWLMAGAERLTRPVLGTAMEWRMHPTAGVMCFSRGFVVLDCLSHHWLKSVHVPREQLRSTAAIRSVRPGRLVATDPCNMRWLGGRRADPKAVALTQETNP